MRYSYFLVYEYSHYWCKKEFHMSCSVLTVKVHHFFHFACLKLNDSALTEPHTHQVDFSSQFCCPVLLIWQIILSKPFCDSLSPSAKRKCHYFMHEDDSRANNCFLHNTQVQSHLVQEYISARSTSHEVHLIIVSVGL